MNHIYALGFATIFVTGGISADHYTRPVKDQSRLPETVYVSWPEKHQDRMKEMCSG